MKRLFALFFFSLNLLASAGLHGQAFVKQWDKVYGGDIYESFSRIIMTRDHGFVVAGSSSSGIAGDKTNDNHDTSYITFDFWIVKTDSNGILLWEKTFGGSNHEELMDLIETADGGLMLAGTSMSDSSGDVTQSLRGSKDYWMVKTDSTGLLQWDRRFGGSQDDALSCIISTNDGGYLLGGSSFSNQGGDKSDDNHNPSVINDDYWIVKTDSAGNKIWDKTIGGNYSDRLQSILQMSGGFLLGGYSASDTGGNKSSASRGLSDYWLVKIDTFGGFAWDKTIGGDNIDRLASMAVANDGGVMLFGTSGSSDSVGEKTAASRGLWDYWVVKTDSNGSVLWDKGYGGPLFEEAMHIIQTADHGFLLSGDSYSPAGGDKSEDNLGAEQAWLVKTDETGNIDWERTIFTKGHDETGFAIETPEGCYVTGVYTDADTGGYKSALQFSQSDYWIIKTCYEAPLVRFASSDTIFCEKKCLDFYDLSTNNPTSWYWSFPGAVPSFSSDQNPVNICYNAYGTFDVKLVATNQYGADSLLVTNLIIEKLLLPPVITVSGDTLFCSPANSYQWYYDTVPIPGAVGNFQVMDPPGSYSVLITDSLGCVATSGTFTTGINEIPSAQAAIVPNPADGRFAVEFMNENEEDVSLVVSDLTGKNIYSKTSRFGYGIIKVPVSIDNISPGIYFLSIFKNTGSCSMKLIIK